MPSTPPVIPLSSAAITTASGKPGAGVRTESKESTSSHDDHVADLPKKEWDWPQSSQAIQQSTASMAHGTSVAKDTANNGIARFGLSFTPPASIHAPATPAAALAPPRKSSDTYRPALARNSSAAKRPSLTRGESSGTWPRLGSDAIRMANLNHLRPEIIRALSGDSIPATTPGIGLDPARTDFFVASSRDAHSIRPLVQLAATVGGRVIMMLALGGISTGFVPVPPVAPNLLPQVSQDFGGDGYLREVNAKVLAASSGGLALGAAMVMYGLGSFAHDTWQLNPRRAAFMGSLSVMGVLGVCGGGILFVFGQDRNNYAARWAACLPRALGNFCVFYALPNAFATSEIVHGNAPIPHREQTRQLTFAVGGAMMMLWAHISSPGLNAPLWAREFAQGLALVGLCVGASLSRTNTLRLEAEGRATAAARRESESVVPLV